MQIDNDKRVIDDLQVLWWQEEHVLYSLSIAVPSLIIWGFGIPLFAWIVLARNKDSLTQIETREKYGFLYSGYKENYYFWETVNMYRKITIIFISVFLKLAGVITQALVVFLVLITFLVLNMKLMPFSFHSLNDMEMLSILTWMLTIYWGLFFLSDMPEVYNSTDSSVKEADNGCKFRLIISCVVRLDTGSKFLFFFVILFSNIIFFLYWTYKMYEEIKNTMRTNLRQVYLCICLCGNKKRLEEEVKKRVIQDENDVLKEEFDTSKKYPHFNLNSARWN